MNSSTLFAQIDTSGVYTNPVGPWSIGGNLNFSSSNTNQLFPFAFLSNIDKSNSFSINPVLTYGITNRTSANLLLAATFAKQVGENFVLVDDPSLFVLRPQEDKIIGFSIGASVDHYFILTKIFGVRLELGTTFQKFTTNTIQEEIILIGNTYPRIENTTARNSFNIFLGPNIDVFLHQRINLVLGLGNIAYTINSIGTGMSENNSNIFSTNFSPDNIGFGMDFNF